MTSQKEPSSLSPQRLDLQVNKTEGAQVDKTGEHSWHLEMPAGPKGPYRLAQLDDYGSMPRRKFPWKAPFEMRLRARASAETIPGTWGFGLWNDPFGMAILRGAEMLRLPTLPNTAWFFFASPDNYLSLRDDLPAQGAMAAVFRAPRLPSLLTLLGLPVAPLFFIPSAARLLRRLGRRFVRQDGVSLEIDPTQWHEYGLKWLADRVTFQVDGEVVLDTGVLPQGPLGLVLWVDNQYVALTPEGSFSFGVLATPEPSWIEIEGLDVRA